jgi:uncharacterized membrane protein YdfJ with MMPL/SSD domain
MTIGFENLTRFETGTETVSLYVKDSDSAVTVTYALAGELSFKESQQYATLVQNNKALAIKLDQYQLGATVPMRGSKIVRADGTAWRVKDIAYSHVSKVHRCICVDIK